VPESDAVSCPRRLGEIKGIRRKNPSDRGLSCITDSPQKKTHARRQGPGYFVENALQRGADKLKLLFGVKARPRYRSLVPAIILKSFPSPEVRGTPT
jgi:hypothetical protein